MQLQNFENKLFGKILVFKLYFMAEMLSLKKDQIKAYKSARALYWKIGRLDITERKS